MKPNLSQSHTKRHVALAMTKLGEPVPWTYNGVSKRRVQEEYWRKRIKCSPSFMQLLDYTNCMYTKPPTGKQELALKKSQVERHSRKTLFDYIVVLSLTVEDLGQPMRPILYMGQLRLLRTAYQGFWSASAGFTRSQPLIAGCFAFTELLTV